MMQNKQGYIAIGIGFLFGVAITSIVTFFSLKLIYDRPGELEELVPSLVDHGDEQELDNSSDSLASHESLAFEERIVSSLQSANSFERPLALYYLLRDQDQEKLVQLLAWSEDVVDGHLRNELQEAVVQQMAMKDPIGALEAIRRHAADHESNLVEIVFQEWSVSNLDDAINHARTLSESAKNEAIEGILLSRIDLDLGRLQEIAQELNMDEVQRATMERFLAEQALEDPIKTWKELVTIFGKDLGVLDSFELQSISAVARVLIYEEGPAALQIIEASLSLVESNTFVGQVLDALAPLDPRLALELAKNLGVTNRGTIEKIIREIAELHPRVALDAAFELDAGDNRVQRAAIRAWAESDPYSLQESMDEVSANLREWASTQTLYSIARNDPSSAVNQLPGVRNLTLKRNLARTIVRNWAQLDPQAAFDWSKSNIEVEEWATELQSVVLETIAQTDPTRALTMAIGEPSEESAVGLEATIISVMASSDVDKAIVMLGSARNQETTYSVLPEIGRALIIQGRTDQAVEMMQDIPIHVQRQYIATIAGDWASSDHLDLFSKIDELPSDSEIMREIAAAIAYSQYSLNTSYSSTQIEFLKNHLPQEMHILFE